MAFDLMSRIPNGMEPLLKGFENFVVAHGKNDEFYTRGAANAKDFVYGCRRVHGQWKKTVADVFYGDLAFVEAMDRVFSTVYSLGVYSDTKCNGRG